MHTPLPSKDLLEGHLAPSSDNNQAVQKEIPCKAYFWFPASK